MRALRTLAAIPLALLLALLSVPHVFWAIGCSAIGDEERADTTMQRTPFWRYLDWIEARG